MNKILSRFYGIMNVSVCMYVLDIIVGIIMICFTDFSIKLCSVVVGSLILIHGLFSLIRYLYDGFGIRLFSFELVNSVASIVLGLFVIFYPLESLSLLGVVFGIWLIVFAICKLFYLFRMIKFNDEIYPLIGFITLLELIMGVVVIINPFSSFMLATKLIGYFLIATSLLDVIYCLLFKKRAKQILKMFE